MSGFRKPQTILRLSPGTYVEGNWVDGAEVQLVIQASVQPVKAQDMATLPAGKRISDFVKLYTDTPLQVLSEVEGLQPDRLMWLGHIFECIAADRYQMGVISHNRYWFSKLSQQ